MVQKYAGQSLNRSVKKSRGWAEKEGMALKTTSDYFVK